MLLAVNIKPNSRHREEVIVDKSGNVTVYIKEPAVEDKANRAAIKLLARHYDIPKSAITIIRGHTSKHKVFNIPTP